MQTIKNAEKIDKNDITEKKAKKMWSFNEKW